MDANRMYLKAAFIVFIFLFKYCLLYIGHVYNSEIYYYDQQYFSVKDRQLVHVGNARSVNKDEEQKPSECYVVYTPSRGAGLGNYMAGFISAFSIAVIKNCTFRGISARCMSF